MPVVEIIWRTGCNSGGRARWWDFDREKRHSLCENHPTCSNHVVIGHMLESFLYAGLQCSQETGVAAGVKTALALQKDGGRKDVALASVTVSQEGG